MAQANGTWIAADPQDISIANTTAIMVQCFGIIIIGYIFGRLNIINPTQCEGIASFTSKLALPSLIFFSLVEINFNAVNWSFVGLIFFSKTLVFALVILVTMILTKPVNLGLASIYAIFCTQGNDFAFGYPILSMLYGPSNKDLIDYLYILAPIQLIVLNPIASVLLELQSSSQKAGKDKKNRKLWKTVLVNLVNNPINIMTLVGIVWNFCISNQVPLIINGLLDTIGKSFSATALFLLGFNIKGRFSQFKKAQKLLLPLVLVAVKIVLSPLLNRAIVTYGMSCDEKCLNRFSSFAFLIGAIPAAPSAFIYAFEYGLKADLIATGMVICTVISGPLMFISANVIRSINAVTKDYKQELGQFMSIVSVISLPCIIWLIVLFVLGRKWRLVTHRCTLGILFSQLAMCFGGYLWSVIGTSNDQTVIYHLQYLLCVGGTLSFRVWTTVLAITLVFLQGRSLCFVLKIGKRLFASALLLTFSLLVFILLYPNYPTKNQIDPNFEFGRIQEKVASLLLTFSLVITVVSIVMQQRYSSGYCVLNENRSAQSGSARPASAGTLDQRPDSSLEPPGKNLRLLDVEDLVADGFSTYCTSNDHLCEKSRRNHCLYSVNRYVDYAEEAVAVNQNIHLASFYDQHQIFPHIVLLLMSCLSMLVSLEVCVGKLFVVKPNGILIELEYLDILLNYGQSIFIFLIFGLDIEPLIFLCKNKFTTQVKLSDTVDPDTKQLCDSFILGFLDRCKNELQFTINDSKSLCYVFRGQDLVRWLIAQGLCSNRKQGETYAQHLINGKVIEHITKEQYFHDTTYLYKFLV